MNTQTETPEPTAVDQLREAAACVVLEAELSAWLEEAADALANGMHDVAEYPDDDPDEGPLCVDTCSACVGATVALAVAESILHAGAAR